MKNLFVREIDTRLARDAVVSELAALCPAAKLVVPVSDITGGVFGTAYLNFTNPAEGGRAAGGLAPRRGGRRLQGLARAVDPPRPAAPPRAPWRGPRTQGGGSRRCVPGRSRVRPPSLRRPKTRRARAAARVLEREQFKMTVGGRRVRVTRAVEPSCRGHVFGAFGRRFQLVVRVSGWP